MISTSTGYVRKVDKDGLMARRFHIASYIQPSIHVNSNSFIYCFLFFFEYYSPSTTSTMKSLAVLLTLAAAAVTALSAANSGKQLLPTTIYEVKKSISSISELTFLLPIQPTNIKLLPATASTLKAASRQSKQRKPSYLPAMVSTLKAALRQSKQRKLSYSPVTGSILKAALRQSQQRQTKARSRSGNSLLFLMVFSSLCQAWRELV